MAVIALREEASPELEGIAKRLHWVSLGELSRALELLHQEGVTRAVMAGQVKHTKIFSSIRPDWKLAKLIFSLPRKNTDSLIGAVARVLEDEGIQLVDSTAFLKPLLPEPGVLTRRAPDVRESGDIAYGREIARHIAGLDLGQTVVVSDRACVAVEAMEGTDETIERAARLAAGKPLVVVKVAKPRQDMRFDVPVVGLRTVETMRRSRATALAIDDDGWLHTGDLGNFDDAGRLRVVGRKKDMFIVGGFNAYPAEIEGFLLEHPAVAQAAVIGVPDERLGQVGKAFVVPKTTVSEDDLLAWCRQRMAGFKAPRSIEFLAELPLNATGKVMKDQLR